MAAPAWATNLTTFWLEGATTVTAIGTGGAGLGNPETDFFIQGTDCISKGAWTNAVKGFIVDALGTTFTVPTTGAVIFYAKYDAQGSLDSKANGGFQCVIGSGSGDYDRFFIGGKDTLAFDSWYPYVIDPNTATTDGTSAGTPDGNERWVGIVADLPTTSGPTKGNPIAIDAMRYGRCDVEYTDGDLGNGYNTFSGAEAYANDSTRRWGLIQLQEGAYQIQGFHSLGISGTAVDFRDSNKVLFWRDCDNNTTNDAIATGFNRIEIINASTNVDWDNIQIKSLGTRSRGVIVHTSGSFDAVNCQFTDMDTFTLLSASSVTNSIFRGCNAITAPGSTLNSSSVVVPTVAANTSSVIWDVATDPDGNMDDMVFEMGANDHHAIEWGASIPTSITLRRCDFTGFNASQDVNASIFHFKDTSGTITINLVGCTADVSFANSYRTDGATIVVVEDPVTTTVNVLDENDLDLQNARVFLEASDGTGDLPYQDSVTISSVTTTATVTHTTHGMSTNDWVNIKGCTENEYNGVFQITVTGASAYTYVMTADPAGSAATGTPIATGVLIQGLTSAGGSISDTRTMSAQPVKGHIRMSTTSPRYKTEPIAGTVSSTLGLTINRKMRRDD